MTITRAPHQTERIIILVVLELLATVHEIGEFLAREGLRVPVVVPIEQIVQRREDTTASEVGRDANQANPAIAGFDGDAYCGQFFDYSRIGARSVSGRALLDDLGGVVIDLRVRHPEWIEYPLLHECGEGLVADHFNDLRQQHVIDVAVGPLHSRNEFQVLGL